MKFFLKFQVFFKFFLKIVGKCDKILSFGYKKSPKYCLFDYFRGFSCFVRLIGLEPTRPEPPDPKSGASTNSATSAFCRCFFVNAGAKLQIFLYSTKSLRANSIKVSFPRAKSSSLSVT